MVEKYFMGFRKIETREIFPEKSALAGFWQGKRLRTAYNY